MQLNQLQHHNSVSTVYLFTRFIPVLWLILMFADSVIAADEPLPILDYQREMSLVADSDNSMRLQVFADGRINVHYPFFMRRAGDYQMALNATELNQLMSEMHSFGLDVFDPVQVKQEVSRAVSRAESDQLSVIKLRTDEDIISIKMATDNGMHEFSYQQLKGQLLRHPQMESLLNLSNAISMLNELMHDSRLENGNYGQ